MSKRSFTAAMTVYLDGLSTHLSRKYSALPSFRLAMFRTQSSKDVRRISGLTNWSNLKRINGNVGQVSKFTNLNYIQNYTFLLGWTVLHKRKYFYNLFYTKWSRFMGHLKQGVFVLFSCGCMVTIPFKYRTSLVFGLSLNSICLMQFFNKQWF
jgi:hypothetical protein